MLLLGSRFYSLCLRYSKLLLVCDRTQPEAVGAAVIMTRATPVTFNKWRRAEVFKAGAWG